MNATTLPHGVMEGKGAYNRNSERQSGGIALAATLLEETAQKVALGPGNQPVVIADYGSSQGKNSLPPMQIALRTLRPRLGPDRPVFVFHIDQPSNDFNSLFEVLSSDPNSYALNDPNVFPCAIGKSFYQQVLPSESVHLGWSSFAVVWLSRAPAPSPDHFIAFRGTPAAREACRKQAEADWESFLSLRARELRPGGRLLIVLPARNDEGLTGTEPLMDHANDALNDMVNDGEIAREERERMVMANYPRQKRELLAPFRSNGRFQNLTVEHCELLPLPDVAWHDYERDGNARAFATRHARFLRAIFMPSLASALNRVREGDTQAFSTFADRLEERIIRRFAANPVALDSVVETIVLAKSD
jgi:hypothetical protein